MLANRFTSLAVLLIGAAIFLVSVDASEFEFLQHHKADAHTRLVSMDAAVAHQKVVFMALGALRSQGYATAEELAEAENTLSALIGEQELAQQMVTSLVVWRHDDQ